MIVYVILVLGCWAYGTHAAMKAAAFHQQGWEKYRTLNWNMLSQVRDVKDDTVIALVSIPDTGNPFGDSMWFDFAVRVCFPGKRVWGAMLYANASDPRSHWSPEAG